MKDEHDLIYIVSNGKNFTDLCENNWTFEHSLNYSNAHAGGFIIDQVMQCPFGKLTGNSQRTLEYYMNPNIVNGEAWLMGWGNTSDKGWFACGYNGLMITGSGNITNVNVAAKPPLVVGQPMHIAATHDGSVRRLFINGTLCIQGSGSLNTGNSNFYIGYCAHSSIGRRPTNALCTIYRIRVSDIVRYTENFTPPDLPFYKSYLHTNLKVR